MQHACAGGGVERGEVREGHRVVGAGFYWGAKKINDCNKSSDSRTWRQTVRQGDRPAR